MDLDPVKGFIKDIQDEALFAKTDRACQAIQLYLKQAREGHPSIKVEPNGFIRLGEVSFKPHPEDKWLIRSPLGKEFVENDAWLAAAIQLIQVSQAFAGIEKKGRQFINKTKAGNNNPDLN